MYYRNRAVCHQKMNHMQLAIKDYEKSLRLEPTDLEARFSLGKLLYDAGEYQKAVEQLEKGERICVTGLILKAKLKADDMMFH